MTEIIEAEAQDTIQTYPYFATQVYAINKPEFLDDVRQAVKDSTVATEVASELYPVIMSDNIYNHEQAKEFVQYVGHSAWNILDSQGYAMSNFDVYFTEMWQQEHYKYSLMEQHSHAAGVQLVGFYFLDTPENCSHLLFHDPRPAKVQINLPQKNEFDVTAASDLINITPTPGLLVFTNAWLPHSFGRHGSDDPIRFIHFNLGVIYNPKETQTTCNADEPEII